MSLVLDASVAIAYAYEDETTPEIFDVIAQVNADRAFVPMFWRIEVANSLEMGVRGGRSTASFRDQSLADLAQWAVEPDQQTEAKAWNTTLQLAGRHRLTLYDAAYLELALRLELPLATLDKALRKAAEIEGVPLLGL